MLKILSAKQIKDLDAYTIAHEPIASIDLMERACKAFINHFVKRIDISKSIGIVCGTGNNGGDGLGIARLLRERRYQVNVWILRAEAPESADFKSNLQRLPAQIHVKELKDELAIEGLESADIIIDAIFGSGLSRPVTGLYAAVIDYLNQLSAYRIAVDIPSGLFADSSTAEGAILKAHLTLSFQLPKLAFLLPDHESNVGEWELLDIGLSKDFINSIDATFFLLEEDDISKLIKPRNRFSHKGHFGKALIVAGSEGKMGACVLAARAAMRSGLGLLTAHVPVCGYEIMQIAVPECMVTLDKHEKFTTKIKFTDEYDAAGIGPGIGTDRETGVALHQLMTTIQKPIVIDADALNILAENRAQLYTIPANSILTPHPKEFERLAGHAENTFERLSMLKNLAMEINCVVLLKGAFTAIASQQGKIYFNSSGNPGMATAGSGDVLSGILTTLLARKFDATHAALLGVYLHGLAGNFAAAAKTEEALIASDIIEYLPAAWKKLISV
ncbi:MAG TPA: NAD(P)H-hydrate dehydratase [Cyclobacteriaceae bacterium]|nr:NAD(P)H-hydrate dehydratase [Cyclobacteriaceae bacterium]